MTDKKNLNELIHHIARIQWACRRGMLELDVLLGDFLENGYLNLADEDKWLFIRLLECPDPQLFAWLMGAEDPVDQDLYKIVNIIKCHRINLHAQ
jgi:antitoxin CptB